MILNPDCIIAWSEALKKKLNINTHIHIYIHTCVHEYICVYMYTHTCTFSGSPLDRLSQNTWVGYLHPWFLQVLQVKSKCSQGRELPPPTHHGHLALSAHHATPSVIHPPVAPASLVGNAEFQVPPQTYWIRTWHFNKIPRWFMWTVELEKHCPKVPNPFPAQILC